VTGIFIKPPLLARLFAGLAALGLMAVNLNIDVAGVRRKVLFTARTYFLQKFHDPIPPGQLSDLRRGERKQIYNKKKIKKNF